MAEKKEWDLTSLHALEGACEWIRKRSGSLMVIAIRAGADAEGEAFTDDSAIAFDLAVNVDPEMPLKAIAPRLELELPALAERVKRARAERAAKEQKARERANGRADG